MRLILGLLLWMAVASCVSFVLYALDKRCAVRERRRIPETTLLAVDLLMGYPGGFLAQRTLRHKNRKRSYQVKFWLIVALHAISYIFFAIKALQ
ncbi:MAG: DUF1294 domain-containing protein [Phycisphaerales bacterium]